MPIQKILAKKTASLTDLRDPKKIIDTLGDGRVAILDRNKVVAYLTHPAEEQNRDYSYLPEGAAVAILKKRKPAIQGVLDYLQDK
ncbi:hypothetical protein CL655_02085 [bacterium]|nr:hypothetical protein [bacterium]|tara:strand:+ start:65 stop:319 length:255 start_codon:yes stop_codon:yes gene_type:complete